MTFVKSVDDALKFIAAEQALLQRKLDDAIPQPQKLETYKEVYEHDLVKYQWSSVGNDGKYRSMTYYSSRDWNENCSTLEAVNQRRDALCAIIDGLLEKVKEIASRNAVIIEHNQKVEAKIKLIMKTIGVSDTYSATERIRGRDKSVSKQAGYLGDIRRVVALSDHGASEWSRRLVSLKETIQRWATVRADAVRAEQSVRAAAEKERKIETFLATMRVKYGLEYDADRHEVLDAILRASKYLGLAHALQSNRNDWSGGPGEAKRGLRGFEVADERDQAIADWLSSVLDDYDGDGRIFANGEWGSHALFGVVESETPELMKDYEVYTGFWQPGID